MDPPDRRTQAGSYMTMRYDVTDVHNLRADPVMLFDELPQPLVTAQLHSHLAQVLASNPSLCRCSVDKIRAAEGCR